MMSVDECPDCGAAMVQRANRKTGDQFWGCSNFPNCTGTRQSDGADKPIDDTLPSGRMRDRDSRRWERE